MSLVPAPALRHCRGWQQLDHLSTHSTLTANCFALQAEEVQSPGTSSSDAWEHMVYDHRVLPTFLCLPHAANINRWSCLSPLRANLNSTCQVDPIPKTVQTRDFTGFEVDFGFHSPSALVSTLPLILWLWHPTKRPCSLGQVQSSPRPTELVMPEKAARADM